MLIRTSPRLRHVLGFQALCVNVFISSEGFLSQRGGEAPIGQCYYIFKKSAQRLTVDYRYMDRDPWQA